MTVSLSRQSRGTRTWFALTAIVALLTATLLAVGEISSASAHHLATTAKAPTCEGKTWTLQVNGVGFSSYREVVYNGVTKNGAGIAPLYEPWVTKSDSVPFLDQAGISEVEFAGAVEQYGGAFTDTAAITDVDAAVTTITHQGSGSFANYDQDMVIKVGDELMKVTARNGENLTVIRGFAGTTAAAHAASTATRWVRGAIEDSESLEGFFPYQEAECNPSETGKIAIFKFMCIDIGQQDTCNGRDTSLDGYSIDFLVHPGDDNSQAPVETITVTLSENHLGEGNTGNGSQGRSEGGLLPVGTYTVCEIPIAYKEGKDDVPLSVTPRPEASNGGSTGGTNQTQYGTDCITVEMTPGTAELKFLDQQEDIPPPEVSKIAATPPFLDGFARWHIIIDNTEHDFEQVVFVNDPGTYLETTNGAECSVENPDIQLFCIVPPNSIITITVYKVVIQTCEGYEITNTVEVFRDGEPILGSPASATMFIPGDLSLCDVPQLAKTAGNYNIATDTATWTITISNTGANTIARDVSVLDPGVTLVSVDPASPACSGNIATTGISCYVPANGTRTLTVSKVVGQQCQADRVKNSATAWLSGTDQPLIGSPTDDVWVSIPADTSLCDLPRLSKSADSPSWADGLARWNIVVSNTGPDSIARSVTITDTGMSLVSTNGASCPSGSIGTGITCTVPANGSITLTVTKAVGQQCLPGTATNSASAKLADTATPLQGSPTDAIVIDVPADTTKCDVPSLSKTATTPGYAAGKATWNVVIANNSSANVIERSVTITDSGAPLESTNGASCTGTNLNTGVTCTVPAGGVVTLTVSKTIGQECLPGEATNSASAVLAGTATALNGSPTAAVKIIIPADTSKCDLPSLSKTATTPGYAGGKATWNVVIANNSSANVIERSVTITDSGAPLESTNGASCTGTNLNTGVTCTVPAGGVVTLTVSKSIAQGCFPGEATNNASAVLAGTSTPLTGSPTATIKIVVPADQALCDLPGIFKAATNPGYAGGFASWNITINNASANAINRSVLIVDAGADLVSTNGAVCDGANISLGITCEVPAGSMITITVRKAVTLQCLPGTAENSATAFLANTTTPINGSPTAPVAIETPADESLCSVPSISKTASNPAYDGARARWDIIINNTAPTPIDRSVTITDANVTLVSTNGATCSGDLATGLTCSVPKATSITLSVARNIAQTCEPQQVSNTASAVLAGTSTALVNSPASAELTVPADTSLCVGRIIITKIDQVAVNNPERAADGDWDFTVTGPNGYAVSIVSSPGTRSVTIENVPLGTGYGAFEVEANAGVCPVPNNAPTYRTTQSPTGTQDLVTVGQTIEWTFVNQDCESTLSFGNLIINKYGDLNGNHQLDAGETPIAGWKVTVTGPQFPGGQEFTTNASGQIVLAGIALGTYTVVEETRAGYTAIGVVTDDNSPVFSVATQTSVTVAASDTDTVSFYNQPRGRIVVTKQTLRNGQNEPSQDGDWTIRVTSAKCGVDQTKKTSQGNPLGTVSFDDLPACDDYVVSEDTNSKPNANPQFSVVGVSSYSGVKVTANGTTTLAFVNGRNDDTPTPTSTPTKTPTATPTSTATPTPIDEIRGTATPGATPAPPSSGTGMKPNVILTFGVAIILFSLITASGFAAARSLNRKPRD